MSQFFVDERDLGMIYPGFVFVNLHPETQQLFVVGSAYIHQHRVIGFLGNEEAHIDAAHGRKLQRGEERLFRRKVTGGQPNPLARAVEHEHDRHLDRVIPVVRPVGHGLHHQALRSFRRRIIMVVEQFLLRREEPVVGENHLEFAHRHAGDLDLHVAPRPDRGIFAGVFAAHVHPADKTMFAVDDLDFAMIAQGKRPAIAQGMGGAKPGKFPAGLDERREMRAPQAEATDAIEKQPHFHAALRRGHEMSEHFAATRVIAPDVKLDMHVPARLVDPLGQRREELAAIDQEAGAFGGGNGKLVQPRKQIDDRLFALGQLLHQRLVCAVILRSSRAPARSIARVARSFCLTSRSVPKTK